MSGFCPFSSGILAPQRLRLRSQVPIALGNRVATKSELRPKGSSALATRPNWYTDHPAACTCARCQRGRPVGRRDTRRYGGRQGTSPPAGRPPTRSPRRSGGGRGWLWVFVIFAVLGVGVWLARDNIALIISDLQTSTTSRAPTPAPFRARTVTIPPTATPAPSPSPTATIQPTPTAPSSMVAVPTIAPTATEVPTASPTLLRPTLRHRAIRRNTGKTYP